MRSWALLLGLLSFAAQGLSGQIVRGQVLDPAGRPVSVALVTLLDDSGAVMRSVVTDVPGEFVLPAGRSGTFQLRVERIGLLTHTTPPFVLSSGETREFPVQVSDAPIVLGAIEAQASARCVVRPGDGSTLATLWEEARKGLAITAAGEGFGAPARTAVHYVRELDGSGLRQTAVVSYRTFTSTRPLFDAIPAATLARDGFVVREAGGALDYFAPSAPVLLSDPFLDRHCFNRVAEAPGEPRLVGLGFEPVRGAVEVGIAGTMWLDRESGEIRAVDFAYRDPRGEIPEGGHGRVEFARLGRGAPAVSRWWIRMPNALELPQLQRVGTIRVRSYQEVGGIIVDGDGLPVGGDDGTLAAIEAGLAVTTAAGAGPGDAVGDATTVNVAAASGGILNRSTLEDLQARGARMEHLVPLLAPRLRVRRGVFRSYDHDAEEIVCIELPEVIPEVADPTSDAAPFCRMLPVVLDGNPLEAPGRFLASAAPGDFWSAEILASHAIFLLESRGGGTAQPEAQGAETGGADVGDTAGALDSLLDLILAGASLRSETLVQGMVSDRESGMWVVGAAIVLEGEGGRHTARTDAEGRFTFAGIAEGEYDLAIRHLAFNPVGVRVEVAGGGRVTRIEAALDREVVALAPVIVRAEARPSFGRLVPVYERLDLQRALGLGRSWDRSELDASGAMAVQDLLRTLPGVTTARERVVLNPQNPACSGSGLVAADRHPLLYLDGIRMPLAGEPLGRLPTLHEIEVIEVYRRPSEVPGEFGGSDAACGVLVLWTRR